MFCSKCGTANNESERFCRKCGSDLPELSLTVVSRGLEQEPARTAEAMKDPAELTGKGIGSVITGDGFLIVAVILSATSSPISSMLWLFLLIPAFFFFGKGFADVLHARQIRQERKRKELNDSSKIRTLPPSEMSAIETFEKVISGELLPVPSVTDRTTRELK